MQLNLRKHLYFLILLFISPACDDEFNQGNGRIPYTYVYKELNMNVPLYRDLQIKGGYVYLNEGYKGIVVIRAQDGSIVAFDRACTYHPDVECAKTDMHPSSLFMACGSYDSSGTLDACCGSKFNLDGGIIEGPARWPLQQYRVSRSGNSVFITSD